MKRLTLSKVCIAAAVVLLILIGQAQQTKTPKRPYEHLLKFSKTQSQKQSQPEKKKNSCQESESIISAFVKELPNKLSTDEKEVTKIRTKILQNESLKKIIIKNNQCGANAASRLANIYSHFGLSDKANEYHKIVLNFAEKDNTTAIANLCGYDAISTKDQKLHYCKIVTNRKNIDFKSAALFFLGQHYLDNNDGDNLIELCLKNTEDKDLCQNLYLFPLGEKLRKEKKYK